MECTRDCAQHYIIYHEVTAIHMKSVLLSSLFLQLREVPEDQDSYSGHLSPVPTHLFTLYSGLPLQKYLSNTLGEMMSYFPSGNIKENKQ